MKTFCQQYLKIYAYTYNHPFDYIYILQKTSAIVCSLFLLNEEYILFIFFHTANLRIVVLTYKVKNVFYPLLHINTD